MAKKPTTPKAAAATLPQVPTPTLLASTPAASANLARPQDSPVGSAASADAPAANPGGATKKKRVVRQKPLPQVPATLLFRKDFQQHVHGELRPGTTLTLSYDAERLPQEKSSGSDHKTYAHLRFGHGSAPLTVPLGARTGLRQRPLGNEPGEDTLLTAEVPVPQGAQEVEVWVSLDLGNGQVYWDSQHGDNYHFRFPHPG